MDMYLRLLDNGQPLLLVQRGNDYRNDLRDAGSDFGWQDKSATASVEEQAAHRPVHASSRDLLGVSRRIQELLLNQSATCIQLLEPCVGAIGKIAPIREKRSPGRESVTPTEVCP